MRQFSDKSYKQGNYPAFLSHRTYIMPRSLNFHNETPGCTAGACSASPPQKYNVSFVRQRNIHFSKIERSILPEPAYAAKCN